MKKIIIFILLLFTFVGITNAKECTVVKGTGENIGDEIECAKEHFYVIGKDNNNVRLMSKYNLLTNGICEVYMVTPTKSEETAFEEAFNKFIAKHEEDDIDEDYMRDYFNNPEYKTTQYDYDQNENIVAVKLCVFDISLIILLLFNPDQSFGLFKLYILLLKLL